MKNGSYKKKVPESEVSKAVDTVAHFGDGIATICAKYGLNLEELHDMMLDAGYDKCLGCGWYHEAGFFTERPDGSFRCGECYRVDED